MRRVTSAPSEDVVPSWSQDGKWIYFASNRSGAWQVWRTRSEGGGPDEQVTKLGGFAALETPDGAYLYYAKHRSSGELWPSFTPKVPLPSALSGPWLEEHR